MQITEKYIDPNYANKTTSPQISVNKKINISWPERIGAIVGGVVLGYLGSQKLNIGNLVLSAGSAFFLYRSVSGQNEMPKTSDRDTAESDDFPLTIRQSIVIDKPRKEVYRSWRALRKLDGVLRHLDEITHIDGRKRYHWEMKLPTGLGQVEWIAEIVEEIENSFIRYRTLKSSDISHSGHIRFEDTPDGQGTEMKVKIDYFPPVGDIGRGAAKALHAYIAGLILAEMGRFKYWLEEGCLLQEG